MNDKIVSITGGKGTTEAKKQLPMHDYILFDKDDVEYEAHGFLIFTSTHVAIMRDEGDGAIPVIVMPMDNYKVGGLAELFDDEVAPF